ncbi:MAG: histidine kinase [Thalassobius sp.]|nr:histidine kinase [Thalassovita sp.]
MRLNSVQKTLFKKALYTSPLMAVPSLSPIMIKYEIPFQIFFYAVLIQSVVVFCLWCFNIGLISISFGNLSEQKENFWRYLISYIFALAVLILVREVLLAWTHTQHFKITFPNKPTIEQRIPYYAFVLSFSLNSVILIIQDLITIREKKAIADLENSQLKLRNAEIINQELKQQIHPHFLFNALNTLKTLIRKEPDLAEDYLIRLSNFLRFSVSTTKANTVRLKDELDMCIDYLEMQKTRFGNTLQYNNKIPNEQYESGFVPIFSIQLLLENAIKHNAMYRNSPLHIELLYEDGRIRVTNNKQERSKDESSTGWGLENLVERYRLLSGDKVIIQADEESFSVSIKVLDYEDCNYRR